MRIGIKREGRGISRNEEGKNMKGAECDTKFSFRERIERDGKVHFVSVIQKWRKGKEDQYVCVCMCSYVGVCVSNSV